MDEKAFSTKYRKALSKAMHDSGMSQSELADRLGVGTGTVGRWLRGLRTPSLYNHYRLMQALKVDL